jgi:hypothetical protein
MELKMGKFGNITPLIEEMNKEYNKKENLSDKRAENQGITWIKENYQILIVYLFLQVPLVIFKLNLNFSILSFLDFGNSLLSVFIIFLLWQFFISAFLLIIIVIRMQLEKKIDLIKEHITNFDENLNFDLNNEIKK